MDDVSARAERLREAVAHEINATFHADDPKMLDACQSVAMRVLQAVVTDAGITREVVARLEDWRITGHAGPLRREAAATIRALRAENEALREALLPFAGIAERWSQNIGPAVDVAVGVYCDWPVEWLRTGLMFEDFRRASRALHPASEDPAGPATPGEETT